MQQYCEAKTIFLERGRSFFSLYCFSFLILFIWSPRALQSTCHQINVPRQKENICLNVLEVEVQREISLGLPATVDCFFLLHLLVNRVIVMATSRKEAEHVSILIHIFS